MKNFNIKYIPFLLVLTTILVFSPTLFNDFQRGWDDTWQVLEHEFVLDHSFENISYHFTDFYHGQYSPINTLVYIFIYKLFGFNAMAFHSTCLLFHLANVLFVFYILKDLLKKIKPQFTRARIETYVLFVALVFAIHPLQVESIAWISASKIVIYAFFFLAALWCYLKYIHSSKLFWLLGVALLYALSFGSKEQAIILPLNLLLLDIFYGRFPNLKLNLALLKNKIVLEKIPFFGMALCFWYFSSLFNLGIFTKVVSYPFYQRIIMGMHSMVEYIFRSIAPVKLYYYYFFPMTVGEKLPLYFWSYIVLTFIILTFVWMHLKKKNWLVVFGFLFFIINILLVLHILPMPRSMITADRYMYLSIVGLALIGVHSLDLFLNSIPKYKKPIIALGCLYFMALGTQSFFRTQQWKNSETMKKNVTKLIERRKAQNQPIVNNPLTKPKNAK